MLAKPPRTVNSTKPNGWKQVGNRSARNHAETASPAPRNGAGDAEGVVLCVRWNQSTLSKISSGLKKRLISTSALSGESEAWQMLYMLLVP